jgi:DNA-binding IclR family transcriptional regulator
LGIKSGNGVIDMASASTEVFHQTDSLSADAKSVLGKAQLVLEAFGMDDNSLSLTDISRRIGVPKTSVYRIAQALVMWGVLERSDSDYRLGMRLFELGSRVPRIRVLRETVHPYISSLQVSTKETVHLAVLDGLEGLFIEKETGFTQDPRPTRTAGRANLHCSATGKVLLAFNPPHILDKVIERGLVRMTPRTITNPKVLREKIAQVQEQGYAIEQEELAIGYMAIAVPLIVDESIGVGAISICAPTFRADIPRYLKSLNAVRRQIETQHLRATALKSIG